MLSPMTGYAATALAWLAAQGSGPSQVRDIAESAKVPAPYLSKIIHQLARKGLVTTRRGVGGGVVLVLDPKELTLYDIAEALDDDILHPKCALGAAECSDARACPAHKLQLEIRAKQLDFLKKTTVQHVSDFYAARDNAHHEATPVTVSAKKGVSR